MEEKTLSLSVFDLEGRSRKSEQELKLIAKKATAISVSYTHLTLPTILRV